VFLLQVSHQIKGARIVERASSLQGGGATTTMCSLGLDNTLGVPHGPHDSRFLMPVTRSPKPAACRPLPGCGNTHILPVANTATSIRDPGMAGGVCLPGGLGCPRIRGTGDGRQVSGSGGGSLVTGYGSLPDFRGGWDLLLAPWILHPGGREGG